MTGDQALIDLDEESESEDQDFDCWEPDPVDADPCKTMQDLTNICIMSNNVH